MRKLFEFGNFVAIANVKKGTDYNRTQNSKDQLVYVSYFYEWCGQFRELDGQQEGEKEAVNNLSEQAKAWCVKKGYRLYSY